MNKRDSSKHQSLSKSRFKYLIDQIERKLNQPNFSTVHQESYVSSSTTFESFKRNRMLPKYLNNSRHQPLASKNQKQISVNLQFNKLILNQKKKFVQHSPNDQDLFLHLPSIKTGPNKNQKPHKKHTMHQSFPKWKLKPLIIERIMLMTQPQAQDLFQNYQKQADINSHEKKKHQSYQKDRYAETKEQQNRKFKQIREYNGSLKEIQICERFSEKEKNGVLNKIKQNFEILNEKQNNRQQINLRNLKIF